MSNARRYKLVLNAPMTLTFVAICVLALVISSVTGGQSDIKVFSVYRSSLSDPLTYVRFFCHIFGHADVDHLINNMLMILILGPMLEEKYGSKLLLFVIGLTALLTGLVHFIFFPGSMLLGASGIVFAYIVLASVSGFRQREIPISFIIVAVVYLGEQVYQGLFVSDNVSHLTHIIGGVIGAICGLRSRR
ncbi:MAG: rhomboid family intramembrane serine protease [Lachnospiraceae bacterium]|nr:rhomboid family intramembrane serine protease [Lachnospiraceae bacterium]